MNNINKESAGSQTVHISTKSEKSSRTTNEQPSSQKITFSDMWFPLGTIPFWKNPGLF